MRGDERERVAYPPPRDLLGSGGAFVEGGGNGASVCGGAFVEGGGAPVEIGAASEFGGGGFMYFPPLLTNPAAPRPPAITTKSSISNTRSSLGLFRFNPVGLSSCFMTTLHLQAARSTGGYEVSLQHVRQTSGSPVQHHRARVPTP